jgi:hypothetical protein
MYVQYIWEEVARVGTKDEDRVRKLGCGPEKKKIRISQLEPLNWLEQKE